MPAEAPARPAAEIGRTLVQNGARDLRAWLEARLATGLIDPEVAASGGRGLENQPIRESWDVMGDWTTRRVEAADWMEVPPAQTARAALSAWPAAAARNTVSTPSAIMR